jgi:hypothetical protein
MSKWVRNLGSWISEHDVLKNINNPKIIRCSQLFWWIAYLRLSEDYWWCCQQKGDCADLQLRYIFEQFGDLFAYTSLDEWWLVNGNRLFGIPEKSKANLDEVKLMRVDELTHSFDSDSYVALIPFGMTTDQAVDQLRTLLDKNLHRQILGKNTPQFELLPYPTKSRRRLLTAYQTWCLYKLIQQNHQCHWRLYEIGVSLGLSISNLPDRADSPQKTRLKQSSMRVTAQQNLMDANRLIANVECGRFPDKGTIPTIHRWSSYQAKQLEEARREMPRFGIDWLIKELAFLDPLQQRRLSIDTQTTVADGVAILTEYAKMDFPFMASQKAARAGNYHARLAVKV